MPRSENGARPPSNSRPFRLAMRLFHRTVKDSSATAGSHIAIGGSHPHINKATAPSVRDSHSARGQQIDSSFQRKSLRDKLRKMRSKFLSSMSRHDDLNGNDARRLANLAEKTVDQILKVTDQLDHLAARKQEQDFEIIKLEEEAVRLSSELAAQKDENHCVVGKHEAIIAELESRLQAETAKCKRQHEEHKTKLGKLLTELKVMEKERDEKLSMCNDFVRDEISYMDEADQLRAEIDRLETVHQKNRGELKAWQLANDELSRDNERLCKSTAQLIASSTKKDDDIKALKRGQKSLVKKVKDAEKGTPEAQQVAEAAQRNADAARKEAEDLTEQRRKLLDATAQNRNKMETQLEASERQVQLLTAELQQNNSDNKALVDGQQETIIQQQEEIAKLSATNYDSKPEPTMKYLIERHDKDGAKRRAVEAENRSLKNSLEEALEKCQELSQYTTEHLNKEKAARAEASASRSQVEELRAKLERTEALVHQINAEHRFLSAPSLSTGFAAGSFSDSSSFNGSSSARPSSVSSSTAGHDDTSSATSVTAAFAGSLTEAYLKHEILLKLLTEEKIRVVELQESYDKLEAEVYNHRLEEEFRQAEVASLSSKNAELQDVKHIMENMIHSLDLLVNERYEQDTYIGGTFVNMHLAEQLRDAESKHLDLRLHVGPLEKDLAQAKLDIVRIKKEMQRSVEQSKAYAKENEKRCYKDAQHEIDRLQRELDACHARLGENHHVEPQLPANQAVHDRAFLRFACYNEGWKGCDPAQLPSEVCAEGFVDGIGLSSVHVAGQKLKPISSEVFQKQGIAWSQPIVGPVTLDDITDERPWEKMRAARHAYLEQHGMNGTEASADTSEAVMVELDGAASEPEIPIGTAL